MPDDHLLTCWREYNCKVKRCPVYGKEKIRCWQVVGTFCSQKRKPLTFKKRMRTCLKCRVYQAALGTAESRSYETLNNIVFILTGFNLSFFKTSRTVLQKSIEGLRARFVACELLNEVGKSITEQHISVGCSWRPERFCYCLYFRVSACKNFTKPVMSFLKSREAPLNFFTRCANLSLSIANP